MLYGVTMQPGGSSWCCPRRSALAPEAGAACSCPGRPARDPRASWRCSPSPASRWRSATGPARRAGAPAHRPPRASASCCRRPGAARGPGARPHRSRAGRAAVGGAALFVLRGPGGDVHRLPAAVGADLRRHRRRGARPVGLAPAFDASVAGGQLRRRPVEQAVFQRYVLATSCSAGATAHGGADRQAVGRRRGPAASGLRLGGGRTRRGTAPPPR